MAFGLWCEDLSASYISLVWGVGFSWEFPGVVCSVGGSFCFVIGVWKIGI